MIAAGKHRTAPAWMLALVGFLAGCGTSGDKAPPPPSPEACGASDAGVPAPLPYAVNIPPREGLWVLDISGETSSREIIARTLQGVMNRSKARIYIVDDTSDPKTSTDSLAANQHWLSVYEGDLGLSVTAMGTLDDALAAFAPELEGYFLASEQEPWSINAATTEAGTRRAVVATADDAAALSALGLGQLDSFVGRWSSAADCYVELAARVGAAQKPAFAVMNGDKQRPRDFLVQQGIVTLAGYPDTPEWAGVQAALPRAPRGVPIYGYTATNGVEELNSVTQISMAGDVLVASDSTPNLSFHMAVHPKSLTRPPPVDTAVDCGSAELNVVIALSDGDNLVVSTVLYPTSSYWLSPDRGKIPIAWSISPALATLAPSVLDYYARTIAGDDELVMMIGAGYAYASQMPNADWFYGTTFSQMATLGVRVLWLFDPLESGSGHYSWKAEADQAATCKRLDGLLDGYYPGPFHVGAPNEVIGGVPVIRALGSYDDGPQQIAQQILAKRALPRAERPRVAFYSAAAWSNDIPDLVAALTPLQAQGVRFLSASAGVLCSKP